MRGLLVIVVVCLLSVYIGLLFFWRFARLANVLLTILFLLMAPWVGLVVLLPIEAAFFYDAGMAWGQHTTGNVVMSAGATLRMNLFGFAIAQMDVVRPFQRPERTWMVRFSLTQGF